MSRAGSLLGERTRPVGADPVVSPEPGRRATSTTFRPDIEALRAFAVVAVLVYHLNASWLPGGFAGVDVFFVISGFLITSHLAGELSRTGTVGLRRFYARRILRLIPASTLVLVATVLGVVLLVPRFLWQQFGSDSAAASTYALNWVLAARSVDYLAADSIATPWQHYWSLAVEEQFYLVWPLLMLVLVLVAQRRSWSARRVLGLGAAGVGVLSFGCASWQTHIGAASAYFTTTTRLWELAVGALAAFTITWVHAHASALLRSAAVVVGLGCLAVSVVVLTGRGWPAAPALLPTTGAALVIIGGGAGSWVPLQRVLSTPPAVWVGGLSYAIYLWHWPLITLAHYRWPDFDLARYAAVVLATVVAAWLSQRLVENPIRFSPWIARHPWRPFVVGAACMLLSVGSSVVLLLGASSSSLEPPANARAEGALVLPGRVSLTDHPAWSSGVTWVVPSPMKALTDVPSAYADGCQQSVTDGSALSCTYGDRSSSRVVALTGDSKALQWLPALDPWAQQRGLKIVTFLKSSCPLSDAVVQLNGSSYLSCHAWYGAVMQQLSALHPALVITSQVRGTAEAPTGSGEQSSAAMVAGLERTWTALTQQGTAVAVIGDTPQPSTSVYQCVPEHVDDLGSCAYDRAEAVAASAYPAQLAAVEALDGNRIDASAAVSPRGQGSRLWLLDLTDAVCPDARRCPPVVGNVLIYRSGSHLTQTYVASLTSRLSVLLDASALVR